MALTCGFYNSVDGDRKYDATQFASLFDGVITDGVVAAVGDFFATTPGGGMVVNVGTGRAWFNRTWTYNDAKIPLTLDNSDLLYDRIDAVVLEIDTSIAVRDNSIKVIKGTPAQEPQKPALTNAGDIHQYALAYVRVKASSIEVGAGDITINVGQADCPFVTSIVETPELEVLFAQWDAQFTEWFENVQAQLEGDVAANLQRQIDLKTDKTDIGDFESPAKKLGLTGDLSVGASLGVLATAGDLHVWRRTVVTEEEIPAGYTLSAAEANKVLAQSYSNYGNSCAYFTIGSSITVDDGGNVTLNDTSSVEIWQGYSGYADKEKAILGKFIRFSHVSADHISSDLETGVYFIPSNATFIRNSGSAPFYTRISTCQKVNAYPRTPPGTHIDYPVSVNPNAYQEGSDAKPAKWELGKIQNGDHILAGWGWVRYEYSESIALLGDHVVLTEPKLLSVNAGPGIDISEVSKTFPGKYIKIHDRNDSTNISFLENEVYYIPPGSTVSKRSTSSGGSSGYKVIVDKFQKVNVIPAVPAGTTIEYLGKLGDKSRMQIVSYVGTGTYGASNPCSITADFPIESAEFLGILYISGSQSNVWQAAYRNANQNYANNVVLSEILSQSGYKNFLGFSAQNGTYGKKSSDGKTISWYSQSSYGDQLNDQTGKYYFLCRG